MRSNNALERTREHRGRAAQRRLFLVLFAVGIAPFLVNGAINPLLSQRPALYWSFELAVWVLLPAVLLGIAVQRGGLRLTDLGLHTCIRGRRRPWLLLLLCLLAGPVDFFLYTQSAELFRHFIPGEALFRYESVVPAHGLPRLMVALYLGISAGLVEELYFRGLFYQAVQAFPHPIAVYMTVSPALFALIHWEGTPAAIPAAFVVGLVACLVFVALKNLWPLIAGHAVTDFLWYQ